MRLGTQSASRGKIGLGRIGLRQVRDVAEARAFVGLERWCRWLNDRDVREHLESTGEWTPVRLEKWIHEHSARTTKIYVIKVDHQAVGTLKMDHVEPGGWPSLGLMIGDKKMWGKGVGSGAIEKACRIAKRAGCAGVWAGIRAANNGSRMAFLKSGFHDIMSKGAEGVFHMGTVPEAVGRGVRAWSDTPARVAVMRPL